MLATPRGGERLALAPCALGTAWFFSRLTVALIQLAMRDQQRFSADKPDAAEHLWAEWVKLDNVKLRVCALAARDFVAAREAKIEHAPDVLQAVVCLL